MRMKVICLECDKEFEIDLVYYDTNQLILKQKDVEAEVKRTGIFSATSLETLRIDAPC